MYTTKPYIIYNGWATSSTIWRRRTLRYLELKRCRSEYPTYYKIPFLQTVNATKRAEVRRVRERRCKAFG